MTWINVAIAVGTAVVGYEQQKSVAKKQDNQLASQLRQQSATEDKVKQRTQQFIQNQQQQTDQPQKTAAAQSYKTALDANKAQANAPLATVGNVSDAYKKAGSDAALGISGFGSNLGNLTASIDAPGQQRQQNARNVNDFGIDVNQINHAQRGQDFLDTMKLNAIHPNPYVGILTSIARAYAGAKLAGAGRNSGSDSPWSGPGYGGIDSGTAPSLGSSGDYGGYA